MRRALFFSAIFFVITFIGYAQFEKLTLAEKAVFGFSLSSKNTFEQRMAICEEKLYGNTSEKSIFDREDDIYNLVFVDGKNYSLVTKIGNLEEFLFKKKSLNSDLISRIENVERFLYKKIDNSVDIINRIKNIYKYLVINDSNFLMQASAINRIEQIKAQPVKEYTNLKKGDILEFVIQSDITNVARKGDKIYGYVDNIKSAGIFNDEEGEIIFNKIINSDKREIDIYRKYPIKGNSNNFIGGKSVELNKVILIE